MSYSNMFYHPSRILLVFFILKTLLWQVYNKNKQTNKISGRYEQGDFASTHMAWKQTKSQESLTQFWIIPALYLQSLRERYPKSFTPNSSFIGITGTHMQKHFLASCSAYSLCLLPKLFKGLLTNLGRNNHSLLIYYLQSPAFTTTLFFTEDNPLFKRIVFPWAEKSCSYTKIPITKLNLCITP